MNIKKLEVNNEIAEMSKLVQVNKDSVLSDNAKFKRTEEYEKTIKNGLNLDKRLMNKNIQNEVSKLQVAEKGLEKQNEVLYKMKNLITEVSLDDKHDIEIVNKDISKYINEIDEISSNTTFENVKLFEEGAVYEKGKFRVPSVNVGGKSYLAVQKIDLSTVEGLNNALAIVQNAITKISNEIALCNSSKDYLISSVKDVTSTSTNSIADANVAKDKLNSLKQQMYVEAVELIESQKTNIAKDVVNLLG